MFARPGSNRKSPRGPEQSYGAAPNPRRVLNGAMFTPFPLELLTTADDRLVRTVDALTPDELVSPSLLPTWSRAHVVAHLALNAEGLVGVLTGRRQGRPTTMYSSQETRDADIAELAGGDASELRDRLLAATHRFTEAVLAMTEQLWEGTFERTPGGQQIAYEHVPLMRLREVEIHHADLGSGYTAADWPADFVVPLLDSATARPYPEPFRARAEDLDREWVLGESDDGPLVRGKAAALGWWVTGRGSGEGLTCDSGPLPRIGPW